MAERPHNGPADLGSRDAFYGRPAQPRRVVRVTPGTDLGAISWPAWSPAERAAYLEAYDSEPDRKLWDDGA
jgi:hypothetical protein